MNHFADISLFESLDNTCSSMSVFNRTLAEDYVDKSGYYGVYGEEGRDYERFLNKNRPAKSFVGRLFGKMTPEEISQLLQEIDANRISDAALDDHMYDEGEVYCDELDSIPQDALHTLAYAIRGIEEDQKRGLLPDDVADALKAKYWKSRADNWNSRRYKSLYQPLRERYAFIKDLEDDWERLHEMQTALDTEEGLPESWQRGNPSGGRDRVYDALSELKEKYPAVYKQLEDDQIDIHRLGYLRAIGREFPFDWMQRTIEDQAKELLFSEGDSGIAQFGITKHLPSDEDQQGRWVKLISW